MLDGIFGRLSHNIGVDLGTANTRVYVVGKGVAVREPTVVARHKKSKQILSIGADAKKMIGKTPMTIEAIRPIVTGVIADFDATEAMLSKYIQLVHTGGGVLPKVPKPVVAVGVPSGVTDVERRAVQDVLLSSGARKVYLVDQPIAAAIGAGVPIEDASGVLIVDIGAGRTEMAVLSLGGIVLHKSIKVAGEAMDEAIIQFLRLKYGLLIGSQTAEELKITIGNVQNSGQGGAAVVRGRDLETGLPVSMKVTDGEIREAIMPVVIEIVGTIAAILEETPPELVSDIVNRGMVVTGGGAMLAGIDKLMATEIRLPVWVADDPLTSVAVGNGRILEDKQRLERLVTVRNKR